MTRYPTASMASGSANIRGRKFYSIDQIGERETVNSEKCQSDGEAVFKEFKRQIGQSLQLLGCKCLEGGVRLPIAVKVRSERGY